MKKIMLILTMLSMALAMNAQTVYETLVESPDAFFLKSNLKSGIDQNMPYPYRSDDMISNRSGRSVCAGDSFLIDYSTANHDNFTTYVWLNNNYSQAETGRLRYVIVAFDSLWNTKDSIGYSYKNGSVTVDSILYEFGHEDTTFAADTLITSIVTLDGAGFPTSNILWSDTLIKDTSFTPDPYYIMQWRRLAPGLKLPFGTKFGVRVDYWGDKSGRFAMKCGYLHNCINYCGSDLTIFYPNTYYYFCYGPTLSGLWPKPGGAGQLYYDCDGNGQISIDSCERIIYQNFKILSYVSIGGLGLDFGNDIDICEGDFATLSPKISGTNTPFFYTWEPSTGLDDPNLKEPKATPSTTTTYTLTLVDAGMCWAIDSIKVNVKPMPVDNLGFDINLCTGCTVTLDAGNPGASYIWSTGATTQKITVPPGTYWVNVILDGCLDNFAIAAWVTDIEDPEDLNVGKFQVYPNPNTDKVTINYSLLKSCKVSLKLYDVTGNQVHVFIDDQDQQGAYKYTIDPAGMGLATGIYFFKLTTGNYLYTRKLVVLN